MAKREEKLFCCLSLQKSIETIYIKGQDFLDRQFSGLRKRSLRDLMEGGGGKYDRTTYLVFY